MAVIGWGAALAAIAPSAGAAASSTTYNANASAKILDLTVLGKAVNLFNVSANDSNSPQSYNLGVSTLASGLSGASGALSALGSALPNGLDVVTEEATANPDGTATGCAAILAGDCTTSPHPIEVSIGLNALSSLLGSTPLSSLLSQVPSLPTSLADYALVLTLNGPTVSCSVGNGAPSATADIATVSVDITADGKSILSGPLTVSVGQTLQDVLGTVGSSPASSLLSTISSILPITLESETASHSATGSTASAQVLNVALDLGGETIVGAQAVEANCSTTAAVTPTKPEKPLGSITTDLGRQSVPAVGSYLALNGMP